MQMPPLSDFWIISLGAVVGANARYWIGNWAAERFGAALPYGNLIINISGSLIIGFVMSVLTSRLAPDPRWRLLIAVGFLGSYTTFSSYTYEAISLINTGQWRVGLAYLFGSSLLGLAACAGGIFLGRLI